MKLSKMLAIILVPLTLGACDEPESRPPTAEQLALRETTWRRACVARELVLVADEEMETLESALQSLDPADPISQLSLRATAAAAEFARAFQRHAELRAGAYAHLDSAVNVAATTADSSRYMQRAAAFSITQPEAGSVEANVVDAYQARFTSFLANDDHPCNWDTPF